MSSRFKRTLLALSASLLFVACGAARPIPEDAQKTIISLEKIDCSDCGDKIVSDLRNRPGVYDAQFDRRRAEITVVASPTFDVFTQVRKLAAVEGFDAILGAGKGAYVEHVPFPEGADVQTVAKDGQDVADLKAYLAKGKVTVVDFSAYWCGPCRTIDQHMAKVLGQREDVAYRRFDIGDWDTPLAKHYLANVPQLPYLLVFSKEGAQIDAITGPDLVRLDQALAAADSPTRL